MAKFRKKPVVIEAFQFNGEPFEVFQWVESVASGPLTWSFNADGLTIPTLEGDHLASPGDWIVQGVAGEFYPCKPDIFEQTYEAVE